MRFIILWLKKPFYLKSFNAQIFVLISSIMKFKLNFFKQSQMKTLYTIFVVLEEI